MNQKRLICTLCSHTIDEKRIITLFEKDQTHRIQHCTNCNTLHPIKKSKIKRWLGLAFKHPFRFRAYRKRAKKNCIQCDCKFHSHVSSHFTFMFPPISLKVSTWKQGVK